MRSKLVKSLHPFFRELVINNDDDDIDDYDKNASLVTDCGIHPFPLLVEINSQPGKCCHHDTGVVTLAI